MMTAVATPEAVAPWRLREDQRVLLHGVTWEQFETILAIRGESSGVRLTYYKGELELMAPSIDHEFIKTTIARLLEAYAEETGVELNGYGSWTVKDRSEEHGVEPDECYVVGTHVPDRPDLAVEVIWTHGGLDKLGVYKALGVGEVWLWHAGQLDVYVLRENAYQRVEKSSLLPDLDLELLVRHLRFTSQTQAVREFRKALRSAAGPRG